MYTLNGENKRVFELRKPEFVPANIQIITKGFQHTATKYTRTHIRNVYVNASDASAICSLRIFINSGVFV